MKQLNEFQLSSTVLKKKKHSGKSKCPSEKGGLFIMCVCWNNKSCMNSNPEKKTKNIFALKWFLATG